MEQFIYTYNTYKGGYAEVFESLYIYSRYYNAYYQFCKQNSHRWFIMPEMVRNPLNYETGKKYFDQDTIEQIGQKDYGVILHGFFTAICFNLSTSGQYNIVNKGDGLYYFNFYKSKYLKEFEIDTFWGKKIKERLTFFYDTYIVDLKQKIAREKKITMEYEYPHNWLGVSQMTNKEIELCYEILFSNIPCLNTEGFLIKEQDPKRKL